MGLGPGGFFWSMMLLKQKTSQLSTLGESAALCRATSPEDDQLAPCRACSTSVLRYHMEGSSPAIDIHAIVGIGKLDSGMPAEWHDI
jgi:hypothetical protein